MFDEMKKQVHDWDDKDEVGNYLRKLLHKEAFDQKGLIYGMGHAVYSISDPRAEMFKSFVEKLAKEKHREKEYRLYATVADLAPKIIGKSAISTRALRPMWISTADLFTACWIFRWNCIRRCLHARELSDGARTVWRKLINTDKIIRPAYMNVQERMPYILLDER